MEQMAVHFVSLAQHTTVFAQCCYYLCTHGI